MLCSGRSPLYEVNANYEKEKKFTKTKVFR